MRREMVLLLVVVFITAVGVAQESPGVSRLSAEAIAARAKILTELARRSETGSGSVPLEKYPEHSSGLAVRVKSGVAEMHANWDDVFWVIDGEAKLMTGGRIVDAKATPDGETRGSRLEGGAPTVVGKGDVIHIAANTPHQMLLEPGKTITYYVEKVAAK
jgi:mannose-6-phosphate isomerase-like protein (cupin superfamily)